MYPSDKSKKVQGPSVRIPSLRKTGTTPGQNIEQPFVEMKMVTWNKDSHGLFDYESKSVDLKYLHIESGCEIYRVSKERRYYIKELKKSPEDETIGKESRDEFKLLNSPISDDNMQTYHNDNSTFIAAVDTVQAGGTGACSFIFDSFKDSLKTLKPNQPNQEAYLIVRSLKNHLNVQKGYKLNIGDIVKFGRIEYQVTQLRNTPNTEPQIQYIDKQIHIQQEKIQTEENPIVCKICLMEELIDETENGFLCDPCSCKGSCEYVHFDCLKNWIKSKVKCKAGNSTSVYSWKKSDCELCKKSLPKHINYKGQIKDMIDIQRPADKPYIVMESISEEKKTAKTVFVFTANRDEDEIKLVEKNISNYFICLFSWIKLLISFGDKTNQGRGHQCEVRISDISVSRTHSMISYKEGRFVIIDNNSKFGTLIKINEPLDIGTDKKAVQIGRTVITFLQKSGQSRGENLLYQHTTVSIPQGPVQQPPNMYSSNQPGYQPAQPLQNLDNSLPTEQKNNNQNGFGI